MGQCGIAMCHDPGLPQTPERRRQQPHQPLFVMAPDRYQRHHRCQRMNAAAHTGCSTAWYLKVRNRYNASKLPRYTGFAWIFWQLPMIRRSVCPTLCAKMWQASSYVASSYTKVRSATCPTQLRRRQTTAHKRVVLHRRQPLESSVHGTNGPKDRRGADSVSTSTRLQH